MAKSGSGKSSLLDFIAGLGGTSRRRSRVPERPGLTFQSPLLFPHMSVLQNLKCSRSADVRKRSARCDLAEQALEDVGLAGFGSRDPATLSGGQQTRVALMRNLLSEPKALLLDEPFSSLDKARRADIRALVFDAARRKGLPVLLVTHDEEDAETTGGGMVHRLETCRGSAPSRP
ncbi:UNVERIFIED_CONTAM: hypothetical protein GTU68_008628 [Idotea baltica]|nr:hypothetical protein [Idotea baltica]